MKRLLWYMYKKNKTLAKIVSKTLNIYNWGSIENYLEEINKRRIYDVWECNAISNNLYPYYFNLSPESKRFCITYWMNKYVGCVIPDTVNIEHGTFFGGSFLEHISDANWIEMILTNSLMRQYVLEKNTGKKCLAIGPYLHYVPDYYNDEYLNTIKTKFGKTLLFFPPHSSRLFKSNFGMDKLFQRLAELKKEYETIMICLFYEDVKRGLVNLYSSNGFIVVTAGHANDIYFLPRLKSIIKMADCTAGITAGTQIGYCIYLKKPHYIIPIGKNFEENCSYNVISLKGGDGKEEHERMKIMDVVETEMKILKCFIDPENGSRDNISQDQMKCAEKYFGVNQMKTVEELKSFLYHKGEEKI